MKQVRVLQLVNGEQYAGAERIQEMLLGASERAGFQALGVALLPGKFVEHAHRAGLPLEVMPMRSRWDGSIVPRLVRYVREHDIELIHTHTVRTHVIGRLVAHRCRVPLVSHVHSSVWHEWDNPLKTLRNVWLERWTRRWCDHFICVNRILQEQLVRQGVPLELTTLVPNGLEPAWFCPSGSALEDGALLEGPRVLMSGWFRPLKGIELLLEAFARLVQKHPAASLVLIGSFVNPRYERSVRARIARLQLEARVQLLGHRPSHELKAWLEAVDAVVLPSRRPEGIPMALLEAMACGKPVVAAAVDGVTEVVTHGENGLLFPPQDPQALANCLDRLFTDPAWAADLGKRARAHVRQHHRASQMIERIETLYRTLCAASGRC